MARTNLLAMALERPKRERPSKRDELVRSIMAKQAFASEPVHSVGYGLTKVANAALLGYLDRKQDREEKDKWKGWADALGLAKPSESGGKLAKVLKGEKIAPSADSFTEQVVAVESGGDPNARNPRSSAAGPGQFIDSTWLDTVSAARPDLMQGRSREDVLQLRSDPGLSREMTEAYGQQNAEVLASRGLPVNDATKYLAHFAGPGGAVAVLTANPDTPAEQLLGRHVVEANPFLAGMTAADIQGWAGRKMNVQPAAQTSGVEPQTVPDPQAINLRREFEPDVGGVGNAYIDMQRQQARSGPPAPDAGRIAPDMPQQPFGAPEAAQGATDPVQEQLGLLSAIPMEEQVVLRQMVESGEIQPFQVLQYARELRAEQQPQWEYKDGQWYQIGPQGPQAFGEPNAAAAGRAEYGLTPVYGIGPDGKTVVMQPSKSGGLRQAELPEGVEVASGVDKIDTGTEILFQDKRTGEIVHVVPKDIAGAEAAKIQGQTLGEAQAGLPDVLQKSAYSIDILNRLIDHPGRETATGKSSYLDPRNYYPSEAKDYQTLLGQMQGRTFLEAYETLKGGGVITEIEGQKAEAALARLSTAQTDEAHLEALKEFRDIIAMGMERAKQKAGGQPQAPAQAPLQTPPAATQPGTTSTGVPWRVID